MATIVPTVTVEVAFTAGPLDVAPVWTELEQTDVLGYSDSMGRRSETDQSTQPATASITLDNNLRTYDPAYTAGPYFGFLRPFLQVRVKGVIGSAGTGTRVLFHGIVTDEGWQQVEHRNPASMRCRLVLTDQLGHLSRRAFRRPLFESFLERTAQSFPTFTAQHWSLSDPGPQAHAAETFTAETIDGVDAERYAPVGLAGTTASSTFAVSSAQVLTGRALRPGASASLRTDTGWVIATILGDWGTPTSDRAFGFCFRLLAMPSRPTRIMRPAASAFYPQMGWWVLPDGTLRLRMSDDSGIFRDADDALELNRTYFVADQWDTSAARGSMWVDGVQQGAVVAYTAGDITGLLVSGAAADSEPAVFAEVGDVWALQDILTADQHANLYQMWKGTAGLKTAKAADLVIEAAGGSSALTGSDRGRVSIVGVDDAAPSPSSILQAIERTELGRLYFEHRSTSPGVKLITREDFATSTRQTTAQATLSDQAADTTALRYSAPVIGAVPQITRATVSGPLGTVTVEDRDESELLGVASVSLSVISEAPSDPGAVASTLLAEGVGAQVLRSVRVQPTTATLGLEALSLRLFDRVTVKRQPLGIGAVDITDYIVEGLSTDIADGQGVWSVSLFLAEVDDDPPRWTWGVDKFTTSNLAGRLTS